MLTILPFPEKFLDFHPQISDDLFFRHRPQISNPPYFRCFSTFPPCFAKMFLSPLLFKNFPPVFGKFTSFLHTLRVVFSPLLWFTLNSARTFRRPSFQRTQLGAANHSAYSNRETGGKCTEFNGYPLL